jgi:ATP-dependent protease HslVU (ClpYQ) peptidase subunit
VTCIVGIEHADGVTIGADSASSNGWIRTSRTDSKLFRLGEYLIGYTSSWRMGQLLRYQLDVAAPDTWDLDRWMATRFTDAVRATLKAGGFATAHEGAEKGGTFLVGVRGRLYSVFDDYQVGHAAECHDAVGSGGALALGSLHTTRSQPDPMARARAALEAAAYYSTTVAPPFTIETAVTER